MKGWNARLVGCALAGFMCALPLMAYDPPPGGAYTPLFGTPAGSGLGTTVTALGSPWADTLNPASNAAQQRLTVDAGASIFTDFGSSPLGSAAKVDFSIPTPYAVWGVGASYYAIPGGLGAIPLGGRFDVRASIAKDLYENFYIGMGLKSQFAAFGSTGWGLGLDFGVAYLAGDWGYFKNVIWGTSITGIGKGYSINDSTAGILGGSAEEFPPPYTVITGWKSRLVDGKDATLDFALDLITPSFQDLGVNLSTTLEIARLVAVNISFTQYLREILANKSNRNYLPSASLQFKIPLGDAKDRSPNSIGEISPAAGISPLYGSTSSISAGTRIAFGALDKNPPVITATFPAAQEGSAYISPNNDGVQDDLTIPIRITDQRYVMSWTMTIKKTGSEVVRKINNKESRTSAAGLASFFDRLVYVRKGVTVPPAIVWNGNDNSGALVPDGAYTVTVEATDDNGNTSQAGPYSVVVKVTPPGVKADIAESPAIFSPDGDGSKDMITARMTGSVEDAWKLQILDAQNKPVRTSTFTESSPMDWSWDGKNDAGSIVPDGVYSMEIATKDRAGNAASAQLPGIVVDTVKPPVGLTINSAAFSPNGDGSKDTVTLSPSVPVTTGMQKWKLSVEDAQAREVWSISGERADSLPKSYPFAGMAASGKAYPEGTYRASLALTYVNGYSPIVDSPYFALDITSPKARVTADRIAFNPLGSREQNRVAFAQSADKQAQWTGSIVAQDGSIKKTWNWDGKPDASLVWNGSDENGKPLPDGSYRYKLAAIDQAGNSFASTPVSVQIDTAKKAVNILADTAAFSPLPSSKKKAVQLLPRVDANDRVKDFIIGMYATDGNGQKTGVPVRQWSATGSVPESVTWIGDDSKNTRVADGHYIGSIGINYLNGDSKDAQTQIITVDTKAPSIRIDAGPLLFSPNAGSIRPTTTIRQNAVPGDAWKGVLTDAQGKEVRSWQWNSAVQDVTWDGTDSAGNPVPTGTYSYVVSSTDEAGNSGFASIPAINLDRKPVQAFVVASETAISPNPDSQKKSLNFAIVAKEPKGIEKWTFTIRDKDKKPFRVFSNPVTDTGTKPLEAGKAPDVVLPAKLNWDGSDSQGKFVQGGYSGDLEVTYLKGDVAHAESSPVYVITSGPQVGVVVDPPIFSPDNDGNDDEVTMFMKVTSPVNINSWKMEIREVAVSENVSAKASARVFKSWEGSGLPAQKIIWDGLSDKGELVESATDYPYTLTVTDALGNKAIAQGKIGVDILVIKVGDKYKIRVPSIVFRPSGADFNDLDPTILENNMRVIRRVSQILQRFGGYNIELDGHANSIGKIEGSSAAVIDAEENNVLLPLSEARASYVQNLIAKNGVDSRRMSSRGLGSSEPVVPFGDAVNRWKNRRVEFILVKK